MKNIYSIKDARTGNFALPIYFSNIDELDRALRMMDDRNIMRAFPEDFIIYDLGTFSEDTGEIFSNGDPLKLCTLASIFNSDSSEDK